MTTYLVEWTGREATMLRRALRLTAERFAARVGVSPRTVAYWASNPAVAPRLSTQETLQEVLDAARPEVKARFHELTRTTPSDQFTEAVRREALAMFASVSQTIQVGAL
ncbi:helix-turn-helix domain-containing protein [Actinomadura sp. NPDC048032]|uniref:helix-turn-helix domain-containing protein n=1 Tax=Actinomadura sp. NPDC048032 TaxID=3155747 RepID=UPI0033C49CDA